MCPIYLYLSLFHCFGLCFIFSLIPHFIASASSWPQGSAAVCLCISGPENGTKKNTRFFSRYTSCSSRELSLLHVEQLLQAHQHWSSQRAHLGWKHRGPGCRVSGLRAEDCRGRRNRVVCWRSDAWFLGTSCFCRDYYYLVVIFGHLQGSYFKARVGSVF